MSRDKETEQGGDTLAKDGGGYEVGAMRPDQPLPVLGQVGKNNGGDLVEAVGAELARRATAPVDEHGTPQPAPPTPDKRGLWQGLRSFRQSISFFRA